MRLLIVHDNLTRCEQLLGYVLGSGYTASIGWVHGDLIQELSEIVADVLIIDILSPDSAFFAQLAYIRSRYPSLGIVMMTDCLHAESYWNGLMNGADYYLLRGVSSAILGATLHALERRLLTANTFSDGFEVWTLNILRGTLSSVNSLEIKFTAKECAALSFLIQNSRHPVSYEAISKAVGYSVLVQSQHRVNVLIYRIRGKLKSIDNPVFEIHNEYARGFLFCCKPGVRCVVRAI